MGPRRTAPRIQSVRYKNVLHQNQNYSFVTWGTALGACEVCGGLGFYFSKENLISPIAEHEHHMTLGIVNVVSY